MTLLGLALAGSLAAAAQAVPPLNLARMDASITLDGTLDEPAWSNAAIVDDFYETAFGDNRGPSVKTTAFILYDNRYFYIGLRCDDPDPSKIRAPYVDRDQVLGTDDNVAVFIDPRNDRRSAQEFRVNPRGVQGDAIFNDSSHVEDFSPDFYYDTAARVTTAGWEAEIRIPFSSLRYSGTDPQTWGLLIWRNYPRQFRYAIYSQPVPRGSNCLICHSQEIGGLSDLPSTNHVVLAPYGTAQNLAVADPPGSPLRGRGTDAEFGLDFKWNAGANTTVDGAINPDFSQVEADVAQIAVNQRFALLFPEKRPFFLEGVDLFDTPIPALYTRTITSPKWGARTTGKIGASAYTLLLTKDDGGGLVVLPGAESSRFAPQDFASTVGIARWRYTLGASYVGALFTAREIDGGGHNRVFGPDFLYRPSGRDSFTFQGLFADSRTPLRPDLASDWDGRKLDGHAVHATWDHSSNTWDWRARYEDSSDEFRADEGFVPQVGVRHTLAQAGYSFFPKRGLFSYLRPFALADFSWDRGGALVNQRVGPAVFLSGKRNLQAEIDVNLDKVRTAGVLLDRKQVAYFVQIDPSRRFSRIGIQGFLGEQVDFDNTRVGHGGSVRIQTIVRPTDHLTLEGVSAVDWLDVDDPSVGKGRLFTAQIHRLKTTYNFNTRLFLRLIGQYVRTDAEPSLYTFEVPRRSGDFQGSALLSYRLNWQTAVFLGYGDNRAITERSGLLRGDRQIFVKLSYALRL